MATNYYRSLLGGDNNPLDDWTRFDRFLILGAEGGTYYITERDLVKQNHDALVRCIKADGIRAVNRIVENSDAGRAPKKRSRHLRPRYGCDARRRARKGARLRVLGQGLPHRHAPVPLRGIRERNAWLASRSAQRLRRWYLKCEPADLALQVVKYQPRNGWLHGDLLRLAHEGFS
jgi:60 kDa SS-A/Ro ribonucleoprotein